MIGKKIWQKQLPYKQIHVTTCPCGSISLEFTLGWGDIFTINMSSLAGLERKMVE
jgi:hypothetical protein